MVRVMVKTHRHPALAAVLTAVLALSGCASTLDTLAPLGAQPKTPVARNFTSFAPALQCMDRMLDAANRPQTRISSTDIPDYTRGVPVGADDMLINAVNQMNRRSRAYVFLDQGRIREGSLIELAVNDTKNKPPAPQFYIRGSISQLDKDTGSASADADFDPSSGRGAVSSYTGAGSRAHTVVSVDLHLVAYPSRVVLPGASVSNSMVVTRTGFGGGLTGKIAKGAFGVSLQINRVESTGQAVRNLIELGLIELLGRHARVPYWECLSLEANDARRAAREERVVVATPKPLQVTEVQKHLARLGYVKGDPTGQLDRVTRRALARFQADEGLVASGEPDFDTLRALRQSVAEMQAAARRAASAQKAQARTTPRRAPAPVATPMRPPGMPDAEGYRSIDSFLGGAM